MVLLPVLWLAACAPVPSSAPPAPTTQSSPADPASPGPYPVGFTNRTFTRLLADGRERALSTDIWYPARSDQSGDGATNPQIGGAPNAEANNDSRHPLVIFSDGLGAYPSTYSILLTHLATYGFVVAAPEHQDCATSPCHVDPEQLARRPEDVESVFDNVLSRSRGGDPILNNLIDPNRVGLAGQSLGGWTTLTVMQTDERFRAGLLMNPATLPVPRPEPGRISRPVLFMAGELDRMGAYSVTEEFFADIPQTGPDHYLLTVPRAGHEFLNRCQDNLVTVPCPDALPQDRLLAIENRFATAFLTHYVAGDTSDDFVLDPSSSQSPDYALVADRTGLTPAALPTLLPFAIEPTAPVPTPSGASGAVLFSDPSEHVVASPDSAPAESLVPGSFADVSIAVDVHAIDPLQGDYISVICRSEDPADRYEFLLLPQSGIFVIERWLHNERAQLTASRTSPAVLSGDRTNHVELSCSGTRITATVNGALVASASDNTFRAGQVGFGIGSFSNQAAPHETRFSDVVALQR